MESKQQVNTAQIYRGLGVRLRNLVLKPGPEWQRIHREETTFNDMLGSFAMPLIGLATLATFVSYMINQQAFVFEVALKKAMLIFMAFFFGLFLTWYGVFRMMKYFQMVSSREVAAKLTIYSSAPLYLVAFVTALVPEFFFVQVLALYSFYLSWTGLFALPGSVYANRFLFAGIISGLILLVPYLARVLLLNLITI
jgi:hypothetical protein